MSPSGATTHTGRSSETSAEMTDSACDARECEAASGLGFAMNECPAPLCGISSPRSTSTEEPVEKSDFAIASSASSAAAVDGGGDGRASAAPPLLDLPFERSRQASRFALALSLRSFCSASFCALVALGHLRSTCLPSQKTQFRMPSRY